MAWADSFGWQSLPDYLVALAYLALSAFFLLATKRKAFTWAFSLYLLFDAISFGAIGVLDPAVERGHLRVADGAILVEEVALWLGLVPLLAFILWWPTPRGSPLMRKTLLSLASALVVAGLAYTAVTQTIPNGSSPADHAAWTFPTGNVTLALTGVAAWVFARDLARLAGTAELRSHWLVVLGFTPYPIYRGIRAAYEILGNGHEPGWQWTLLAESFSLVVTPLALVAWWRLVRVRERPGFPWGLAGLLAATVFLGFATALDWVPRTVSLGTVQLLLPVAVVYGLVRHSLFDFDGKVRWTVSKGVSAGVILMVFLVGSKLVETYLGAQGGPLGGAVLAGVALFALNPIQRVADRVASAAIPMEAPTPRASQRRQGAGRDAEAIYRTTLRKFLADGVLTRDEERHLAQLTASLGIDAARAFDLREDVERERAERARLLQKG